jgi:hypothetical protein
MYTALGISGVVMAFILNNVFPLFIAAVIAAFFVFRRLQIDKYVIAPKYSSNKFNHKAFHSNVSYQEAQNLVVYAGYDPFVNFGFRFNSWNLSIDITRKNSSSVDGSDDVKPVDIAVIEQYLIDNLSKSGLLEDDCMSLYFVQGANIPAEIKQPGAVKPPIGLSRDMKYLFKNDPDSRVRRYLWLRKRAWNNEISLSYFVRLTRNKSDLNIEITGVFMPPVGSAYRWVDNIPPRTFRRDVGDVGYALFWAAIMPIISTLYLYGKLHEGISNLINDKKKVMRRNTESNLLHDFGAPMGLRRSVADPAIMHYFQTMDRRSSEIAWTARILRTIIDYLDECNIDTSELSNQRNTVLNQGIIVQNGNINANNIVSGANSVFTNIANKVGLKTKEA